MSSEYCSRTLNLNDVNYTLNEKDTKDSMHCVYESATGTKVTVTYMGEVQNVSYKATDPKKTSPKNNKCSTNYELDKDDNMCYSCEEGTFNKLSKKCVIFSCPTNYVISDDKKKCIPSCPSDSTIVQLEHMKPTYGCVTKTDTLIVTYGNVSVTSNIMGSSNLTVGTSNVVTTSNAIVVSSNVSVSSGKVNIQHLKHNFMKQDQQKKDSDSLKHYMRHTDYEINKVFNSKEFDSKKKM